MCSSGLAPDTTAPTLDYSYTSSNGQTISLTFSEQLKSLPTKDQFNLSVNGEILPNFAIDSISLAPVDASGTSVNAAASSDFSNASYDSASFSIRLDATNGIDTATFSPASALTAFSIWVNGTEQTGRIASVDLEPAGTPTGIRLNLNAGTAFTAADNIEVRYEIGRAHV